MFSLYLPIFRVLFLLYVLQQTCPSLPVSPMIEQSEYGGFPVIVGVSGCATIGVVLLAVFAVGFLNSLCLSRSQVIPPQQVLYGHTARVWDVVWIPHYLLSIGEDATCRVWDQLGNSINTITGHRVSNYASVGGATAAYI